MVDRAPIASKAFVAWFPKMEYVRGPLTSSSQFLPDMEYAYTSDSDSNNGDQQAVLAGVLNMGF